VAHNCVEENTLILKADLTWCKAKDLNVGDKLIGFEEGCKPGDSLRLEGMWNNPLKGKGRKIQSSIVTENSISEEECVEVLLSNGEKIITTPDHHWIAKSYNDNYIKWIKSSDLKPGYRIPKGLNVKEPNKSYESGWMSGFISGEGTLKKSAAGSVSSIDFCQRPTVVLDKALEYSKLLNIDLANLQTKIGGLGKGDTLYTYTLGGKWRTIEILAELQINRLIDKIDWNKFGSIKGHKKETSCYQELDVISVTKIGKRRVSVLGTSTNTYIAAGYFMHNCKKFDYKRLNTRFIYHNLPPLDFKIIDTLDVARKYFSFTSNRLDDLAKFFGFEGKNKTEFSLWSRCMQGNPDALEEMRSYNVQDVVILEKIYKKLRPYIKNHPNIGNMNSNYEECCPSCGSPSIKRIGMYHTSTSTYPKYRCEECGALSRKRLNENDKEKMKNLLVSI
jgi:hypothetical protein